MRFVIPETKRYYLKNGADWIEIKKELTAGEDKRYRTAGLSKMTGAGTNDAAIDVNWTQMSMARVQAYLHAWSEHRPITPNAIEDLSMDDFEEIDALIVKHIDAMKAEKEEAAKNVLTATATN